MRWPRFLRGQQPVMTSYLLVRDYDTGWPERWHLMRAQQGFGYRTVGTLWKLPLLEPRWRVKHVEAVSWYSGGTTLDQAGGVLLGMEEMVVRR